MGWGKAASAQNQATQLAMIAQAQQAQRAQEAIQEGQAQAAGALRQGQTQGVGAINRGIEGFQPYQAAGVSATNQLAQLYGPGGAYTQMPTLEQLQMDPSYAFRERQGMKALQQSAAARGGLLSGTTLKGIQNYAQDLASTEYGNAYNRFMANREAAARGLAGLYGGGLTAAGGMGNLASNLAGVYTGTAGNLANVYRGASQDLSQNYTNLGQALGQGYANIGANNASAYMAPTNFMASLAGQIPQAAAMYAGGGFGGGSPGMAMASRAMGGGGSPFPQGAGGYNAAMGYMRS